MKVRDAMMTDVCMTGPEASLREAAGLMAGHDVGVLPVMAGDRLVGMITDRDIAIRGTGRGLGPEARVEEVMSPGVRYCFDDQSIDEVVRNMGELQLRRLPVVNRAKRLVGILSLGDVALVADTGGAVHEALSAVSRPSAQHNQVNPA